MRNKDSKKRQIYVNAEQRGQRKVANAPTPPVAKAPPVANDKPKPPVAKK